MSPPNYSMSPWSKEGIQYVRMVFPPPSGTHVVPSFLCLVIAAFAVAVLFAYVYPWAERFFGLGGAAVRLTGNEHSCGGRHCAGPTVFS